MIIGRILTIILLLWVMESHASAKEIKLIVRGDDLDMSQGSLLAFEKAFKEGILTCASHLKVEFLLLS